MFYTTEQPRMSLTAISISARRIMRLTTHDLLVNNIRSESDTKRLINFRVMLNRRLF
jgi:hypothetical protein